MADKDFSLQDESELEWGEPDTGMGHYGPHIPIEAGDKVLCAECGAVAKNGIPEAWP